MNRATRSLLSVALVVMGVFFYEMMRPVGQPPGVLAPDPPVIGAAPEAVPAFERGDHVMTGLAPFRAQARIVSIERYGKDREAKVAPVDVVLGWGPLSDSATFKGVDVGQTGRTVLFESYDPNLPKDVVAGYLVNLHMVGADAGMDAQLRDLRRGNIVEIEGWLVEVRGADGWRWRGEPRAAAPAMPGAVLRVHKLEAK